MNLLVQINSTIISVHAPLSNGKHLVIKGCKEADVHQVERQLDGKEDPFDVIINLEAHSYFGDCEPRVITVSNGNVTAIE